MEIDYTSQIKLIHLSDIHFGDHNICNPDDPSAAIDGLRTLDELITTDLNKVWELDEVDLTDNSEKKETPLIIVASGDFTQKASGKEFEQAAKFLNDLIKEPIFNQKVSKEDIFMVPGNHDVVFDKDTPKERFQPYVGFYNEFYEGVKNRTPLRIHEPLDITKIITIDKDGNRVLIAEINCCMYVQKDTVDKSRGQVSLKAIEKLESELEQLKTNTQYRDYIKIAVLHHHLVLLPSFIETGRGVDSILNAHQLLDILGKFSFHLILHGHKHIPQIFSYDPVVAWAQQETIIPQLVLSGGSCGSTEISPQGSACVNTYSVVTIKWHPAAQQARVRVITRGLKIKGEITKLLPSQWKWETVNICDKILSPYQTLPISGKKVLSKLVDDSVRDNKYAELKGALPVIEVIPSLIPGQAYEARAWIEFHKPNKYPPQVESVEWSAGKYFKVQTCRKDENPNFTVSYHFWGPMLIQAKLTFTDDTIAYAHVYARLPKEIKIN